MHSNVPSVTAIGTDTAESGLSEVPESFAGPVSKLPRSYSQLRMPEARAGIGRFGWAAVGFAEIMYTFVLCFVRS